jgi:hypothetical protein
VAAKPHITSKRERGPRFGGGLWAYGPGRLDRMHAATMSTEIVTRTERCAYCLTDAEVVTVEQLLSQRGDVVASTVLEQARCTNADCIGSKMPPR